MIVLSETIIPGSTRNHTPTHTHSSPHVAEATDFFSVHGYGHSLGCKSSHVGGKDLCRGWFLEVSEWLELWVGDPGCSPADFEQSAGGGAWGSRLQTMVYWFYFFGGGDS